MFHFKGAITNLNLINIIVGFGLITTIFLSNQSDFLSTRITIPYRYFSLSISLLTILINFNSFSKPSTSSLFLMFFYSLYVIKIAYTVVYTPNVFNVGTDISMYFSSSIGFVLIPAFSVLLSLKNINFDIVLRYSFYATIITALISIRKMDGILSSSITERLNGNIAISTITFGNIGVSLFCFAGSLFSRNFFFKGLSIFALLIGTYIVIISGSRGPAFSLFFCIFATFIFRYVKSSFLLVITIFFSILLFFLSPFILLVIGLFSSVSADRILSTLTEGDSGDRDQYFNAAIYQFLNSPFWGGSFVLNNGIGKGDYPHNLFLESLLAFGIFGGLVIIYFYYRGFKSSFNLLYFNYNNKWLALLFIQFFIFSSISGALWSSIHFIIILSILLNGSYIKTANSTAD